MSNSKTIIDYVQGNILGNFKATAETHHTQVLSLFNRLDLLSSMIETISNDENKSILDEIQYDFYSSILFSSQCLYRYSFVALRSLLELSLSCLYFIDHNYNFLLWKKQKMDISWSKLMNKENGFITEKYFEIFNSESKIDIKKVIEILEKNYRICSEYVHGKFNYMSSQKNPEISYQKKLFDEYELLAYNITDMIIVLFSIRFKKIFQQLAPPQLGEVTNIIKKYEV